MSTAPPRPQIEDLIRILAGAEGLDPELLIRQCAAESSFDPDAFNTKSHATGLFQLVPSTAAWLKVNPRRWHENVFGGVKYAGMLFRQFSSDYAKMLAAYNWGPGNLDKCLRDYNLGWRDHLPEETKKYLTRILPK